MKERIIFRHEYDPYMKIWKYLCVFPDAVENWRGDVGCVSIWKADDGHWWHESYGGVSREYCYKCKIIHKNSPDAAKALEGIKAIYGGEYTVVEKMGRR